MAIPHCEDDTRVGRYPSTVPTGNGAEPWRSRDLCSTLALSGHAPGPLRASLAACSTRSLSRPPLAWLRSTGRADTVEAGVL
eukprot:3025849-Rhodomonas_salina.1